MARVQEATEAFGGTLANWTQWYPAWGNASIVGGALQPAGGAFTGVRYSATSPSSNDQYCKVTVGTLAWNGPNCQCAPGVRVSGSDGTRSGYFARVKDDAAANRTFEIIKVVSGTETVLSTTTRAISTGDTIDIEVEGTNLRAFHNGTQVSALDITDSALSSGDWGICGNVDATDPTADDADMGTLGASAPTVTAHPVGSAAAVGATTQYSITATGATSYQWQVSTNGGETWASVSGGSGGTTATYTTPTTVAGDNGKKYRCVAANTGGSTNSLDAFFHVSGIGLTGRGRGTSRAIYPPLIDPQILVRIDPRVCPESGPACFDDFATAFKDIYFYSDPVPPAVPNEVEHWTWSTRNRPGSGPLSTGKFFIAQRPIITAAAAVPQVNATPGAWTWAGVAVGRFRLVAATPGAWTWTGPTVGRFRLVAATPGTWTWTGPAAGLSRIVSATPGAWTWAGVGAQLVTTATVNASPGAWTWAGVGVGRFRVTNATPGAWTWAGVASSLSRAVSASPGAWTWAGVSVGRSRLTNATPGVWTWAGTTTGISVAGSVNATPGAFTWAGTSSGLSRLVHATPGAWTWTGPSVGRSRLVAATPGAFSWAGTASTLRRLVAATPGSWSWSGTQSGIVSLVVVNAAAGQWTWVGNRSGISTGAASADATGGWPIAAMVAEMRRRAQRERERLKALEDEEEERQRAISRAKSPPAKEKAKASLEKTKLALANQERLLAILTQEIAQALAEEARASEEADEREVIELFLEML